MLEVLCQWRKSINIPTTIQELTPSWLNEALQSTGASHHCPVTACQIEDMSDGPGYAGQLVRLKLAYAASDEGLPTSLIAKLSHPKPETRNLLHAAGLYEREIRFYQELATQAHLPTPRCYCANIDMETGACILLLEDLAHLKRIDRVIGCTFAEAEVVIQHLARFHAHWWNSPQLQASDYLKPVNRQAEHNQEQFQAWWPQVPQKLAKLLPDLPLPPTILDLGLRFGRRLIELWSQLSQAPITLVHGDTHFNNLLFGPDEVDRPLVILDWQSVGYGRGAYDVAQFMVPSLTIGLRRQVERGLLQTYHSLLLQYGVSEYDFETCWADYQKGVFRWVFILAALVNVLNVDRPEGRAALQTLVPRTIAFCEDHDLGQFL